MPLSLDNITKEVSLELDGTISNIFRYDFYNLAKANYQYRVTYKRTLQTIISQLYQVLSQIDGNAVECSLIELFKQALNCLSATIKLKDHYVEGTIHSHYKSSTQKVEYEFQDLQNKLKTCIGPHVDDDRQSDYLALAPVQQIILLLLFYGHFHIVDLADDQHLSYVVHAVLDSNHLENTYKHVVGYLYYLQTNEALDDIDNPLIQLDECAKQIEKSHHEVDPQTLQDYCQRVEITSPRLPNYLSDYLQERLPIHSCIAIMEQLSEQPDKANELLTIIHNAWHHKCDATHPLSANFIQVLKHLGRLFTFGARMNLLQDTTYLLLTDRVCQISHVLAKFYHHNFPWDEAKLIKTANQNAISQLDRLVFSLNFVLNGRLAQAARVERQALLISIIHKAMVPLLTIYDKELFVLYSFITQCNVALNSDQHLDEFLNNYSQEPFVFRLSFVTIGVDSFFELRLPATTQILIHHIQQLLTKLYQAKPPQSVKNNPVQLESLIDIFQTAYDIYRCLNKSFQANAQFQEYIDFYKIYHKNRLNNDCDQFHCYEREIRTLFIKQQFPSRLEVSLPKMLINKFADLAEDVDKTLDQLGSPDKKNEKLICEFYQRWFKCMLAVLVLRHAQMKQDINAITNGKQHLQTIIHDFDKFIKTLGLVDNETTPGGVNNKLVDAGLYILIENASQQALMLIIYSELYYPSGLLSNSVSHKLLYHLHKHVCRHQHQWIIDYCHYKRLGFAIQSANPIIVCETAFSQMASHDYSHEELLSMFKRALLPSDSDIPYFLRYSINLSLFLHSAFYILQNRSFPEADHLLSRLIGEYIKPEVCSELNKNNQNLVTLLLAINQWFYVCDSLDFFQDSDSLSYNYEPVQLISLIRQLCRDHNIKLANTNGIFDKVMSALFNHVDHKIGIIHGYDVQLENQLNVQANLQSVIDNQLRPLLSLKLGESCQHTPLSFLDKLQCAFADMMCQGQKVLKLDCSDWYCKPYVIKCFKAELPKTSQYIVSAIRDSLLAVYHHCPPSDEMPYENAGCVIETFSMCKYIVNQQMQLNLNSETLNVDTVITKYQNKLVFNWDELNTLEIDNDKQNSKSNKNKNKNKKQKKKQKKKKLDHLASEQRNLSDQDCCSENASKLTVSRNPRSKPSYSWVSIGEQAEDRHLNEKGASVSGPEASVNTTKQKPLSRVKSYIHKDELPEFLIEIKDSLFKTSNKQVCLALTGGAVLALCRQEPDKIRDYDCIATVNDIKQLKFYLIGDQYADHKPRQFKWGDKTISVQVIISDNPLLVVTYRDCVLEISAIGANGRFYDNMLKRVFEPCALYSELNEMNQDDTFSIRGLRGALEALDNRIIRAVVPKNEEVFIEQRFQDDPIRIARFSKLISDYPDLKTDDELFNALKNANNAQNWQAFVAQGSSAQGRVGNAIQALFNRYSVETAVRRLLDPEIGILAPLINYSASALQACEDAWVRHIKQAQDTDYEKKLYLFHCLVCAHLLQCNKRDNIQLPFVWVKHQDKLQFNYLSWQTLGTLYFKHDDMPPSHKQSYVPRRLLKDLARQTRDLLAPQIKLAQDYTRSTELTGWVADSTATQDETKQAYTP